MSQYGQHVAVTDLAERQSIDDLVPEFTENFSEAMTEALDLITRDILVAGTNVVDLVAYRNMRQSAVVARAA